MSNKRYWSSVLAKSSGRILRILSPESAHNVALSLLKTPLLHLIKPRKFSSSLDLNVQLPNIGNLPHPIGLAAGFDKDAVVVKELEQLGFSFIEVGTITPKAQTGNPKPRVFRYPEQNAIINNLDKYNMKNLISDWKDGQIEVDFNTIKCFEAFKNDNINVKNRIMEFVK